jgi:hypothetical protein
MIWVWFLLIPVVLLLLVCLCFLGYWYVCQKQGDCDFRLLSRQKTPFHVEKMDQATAILSATVPIRNVGRQGGTIMDCFARPYLPREQYDAAKLRAVVYDVNRVREDDYWEALIVYAGDDVKLTVKLTLSATTGNILRDLETFPDMPIDIIFQTVGRSDWEYRKGRIYLEAEELRSALYEHVSGGRA